MPELATTPDIRERRRALGLKITDVARRTGLSRQTVWRFENGHSVCRSSRRLIAIALDLPVFLVDPQEAQRAES
jgi:transcriptional regulator with XRE-family HTH domain